jgi:hypothetical protein
MRPWEEPTHHIALSWILQRSRTLPITRIHTPVCIADMSVAAYVGTIRSQ